MERVKYEAFNEQMHDLYAAFREACAEAKVENHHEEWKNMLKAFSDDLWLALTDYRRNLEQLKELFEFFEELAQEHEPTNKE